MSGDAVAAAQAAFDAAVVVRTKAQGAFERAREAARESKVCRRAPDVAGAGPLCATARARPPRAPPPPPAPRSPPSPFLPPTHAQAKSADLHTAFKAADDAYKVLKAERELARGAGAEALQVTDKQVRGDAGGRGSACGVAEGGGAAGGGASARTPVSATCSMGARALR